MAPVIGGPVRSHVQACADTLVRLFGDGIGRYNGVPHISTYEGHQPSRDLGIDLFPKTKADGIKIAQWVVDHAEELGVDYVIYNVDADAPGEINNPPDREYWRQMEDRGGRTANHDDHIHISFLAKGPATLPATPSTPTPTPTPIEEDEPMAVFITSTDDDPADQRWFVTDGITKRELAPDENQLLVDLGIVKSIQVKNIPAEALERIPTVGDEQG